jgi:ADP-ribosylglycohydrolase
MAIVHTAFKDRFEGCLLGLAVGDALGGRFEAQTADAILARFSSVDQLIAYPQDEIWYTDDTQMAIGVAETLIASGQVIESPDQLASLGNRIEALHSVPTAIASFGLTPESYEETIGNVILLGGDTDTLAAMAGALSGAYLGIGRLPSRLLELLEHSPKGAAYLKELSGQLMAVYRRGE